MIKIGNGIAGMIYAGKTRIDKDGFETWVSKEDVTNQAISAVYQWFIDQSKSHDGEPYEISYKGLGNLTYTPEGKDLK